MKHIAFLAARTLFSVGVDTAFGTEGHVDLNANGGDVTAALVTGGATYVAQAGGAGSTIVKFDSLGQRDSKWNNRTRRPAFGGVVGTQSIVRALAEDARTGYFFAAGTYADGGIDGAPALLSLKVNRLKPDGQSDDAFGLGGQFDYDVSETDITDLQVKKIVPLPRGGLMVLFDRQTGGMESEVVLLKLRPNGTRDPAFGTRGTKTLLSATRRGESSIDNVTGNDMAVNADGSVRVLFSKTDGVRRTLGGVEADDATFQLKSRSVSATGVNNPAGAYSWTLATRTGTSDNRSFAPLFVGDDGPGRATVVGRTQSGTDVTRPTAFSLVAGRRPTQSPFATGLLSVTNVARGNSDYYFGSRGTRVVRLNRLFRLDPAWGENGVASIDDGRRLTDLYPAAGGNVLVASRLSSDFSVQARLDRLNG